MGSAGETEPSADWKLVHTFTSLTTAQELFPARACHSGIFVLHPQLSGKLQSQNLKERFWPQTAGMHRRGPTSSQLCCLSVKHTCAGQQMAIWLLPGTLREPDVQVHFFHSIRQPNMGE